MMLESDIVKKTFARTAELIAARSIAPKEEPGVLALEGILRGASFPVERIEVAPGRDNLWVSWGRPQIVFTTHIDVVPAPDEMFLPRWEGSSLVGRGACDAKGIAATMIGAVEALRARGVDNVGMLFVVGEELDAAGAIAAAQTLRGKGIRFIVNGEPTECKLVTAHKGGLELMLRFTGTACHSGYPELGVDANRAAIEAAYRLITAKLPADSELGATTINIGVIRGGVAGNVVSPSASLQVLARTVSDHGALLEVIREIVGEKAEVDVAYNVPVARMVNLPGFSSRVAAFCTDIPNFAPLGAECLLYGPGSIHVAHTQREHISEADVAEAYRGYLRIYDLLNERLITPAAKA